MVEHFREVLNEAVRTNNFKLITEKLSFEERKYFVDHIEEYELDEEVADKLDDNFDSLILFTSDEKTNLIKNIETCSEIMQDFLIDDMSPEEAVKYFDKINEFSRGKIVEKMPPEEAVRYFDGIDESFRGKIVEKMPPEEAVRYFDEIDESFRGKIVEKMPPEEAVKYFDKINESSRGRIVEKMPPEEAVRYFDKVSEDTRAKIMEKLDAEEAVKYLGEVSENTKKKIIEKLDDEEAVKYFDKISEDTRAEIMKNFKEPVNMLRYLDKISENMLRRNIIDRFNFTTYRSNITEVLKTPEERIKYFHLLESSLKNQIMSSLTPTEIKEHLGEAFDNFTKVEIISESNLSDDEKIGCLDKIPEDSRKTIIENFKEPINKIKCLQMVSNNDKYAILQNLNITEVLKTEEEKIEYLDKFPEQYKTSIISSFSEPITKIEYLDKVSDVLSKKYILDSISEPLAEILKTDEEKIRYLDKLPEVNRIPIIRSFSEPITKIEYLDKVSDDQSKKFILDSISEPITEILKTDEEKIRYLGKFPEEYRALILDSIENLMTEVLNTKEERMKYFPLLTDKYKTKVVILDFKDEEKIKYLDKVSTEDFKAQIISSIKEFANFSSDVVLLAVKKNPNATIDEYAKVLPLMTKIVNSNSLELSSFASQFYDLIVQNKNSGVMFKKIENIFLRNNIPTFGKIFLSFQTIYPEFEKEDFSFSEGSCMSPEFLSPTQSKEMKVASRFTSGREILPRNIRFQILFNDLLRIASGSNNRSLLEYLNNIEIGNKLFLGLQQGIIKFNNLDNEAKNILEVFSNHLQALYENMSNADVDKLAQVFAQLSIQEKITYFSEKFSPNGKYDLPDRIVRGFCYQAGIKNFEQLRNMVTNSIREKEQINRTRAKSLEGGQTVKLRKGDFVRAMGEINVFGSSLDNGNVCRELLVSFTGTSESDSTPLDIDFSLITEDNKSIYDNIVNSPTSFNYGNIYIILKGDNPNIDITRDEKGKLATNRKYDPSKIEMFRTRNEKHWGARTGIASSDIDYILYKRCGDISSSSPYDEKGNVNYNNAEGSRDVHELSLLKMEIVKNGFYIPVIDFSGKIIFTPEEFDKLKGKMDDLSHYEIKSQWNPKNIGPNAYHMSEHSQNTLTDGIKKSLSISKEQTDRQSEVIAKYLANIIGRIDAPSGGKMKYKSGISGELTSGTIEVISTGSTSRNTNIPGDYDFDYIFRIDTEIYRDPAKMEELYNQVLSGLEIKESDRTKYILNGGIREAPLTLSDGRKVPLDITFVRKTDKVEYSTDMALKDRMTNISRNSAVADEVKANIILAKMLLKSAGCYKPNRRDSSQGGLGGVGIENWIFQNGGSLESAAESFLEAAKEAKQISAGNNDKEYLEFLRRYQVYDFGANHLAEQKRAYPYDEFVYTNMNLVGYQKMCHILEQYLKFVRGDKQVLDQPEFENIVTKIEQLEQFREEAQKMLEQYQEEPPSYGGRGGYGSRGQVTFLLLMAISFILSMITIIVGIVSYK